MSDEQNAQTAPQEAQAAPEIPEHIRKIQHPDAPKLPKQITLHSPHNAAPNQNQTVMVHHEPHGGLTAGHRPGHQVHHALAHGMVPAGYTLKLANGRILHATDNLYHQVENNDTVTVVPVPKDDDDED